MEAHWLNHLQFIPSWQKVSHPSESTHKHTHTLSPCWDTHPEWRWSGWIDGSPEREKRDDMLSKPSAPEAQLYGRASLFLTPLLPFSSAFCSPTDPVIAGVNCISCVIFQHSLTYPWLQTMYPPSEAQQSLAQLRQRVANTKPWQTGDKSLNEVIPKASRLGEKYLNPCDSLLW